MMLATLPRFPCARDKRPLIQDWPNRATFDPLNDYGPPWINEHQWPLTAVVAGPRSGVVVLDIDLKSGAWLTDNRHRLPRTRVHQTRSGGEHWLYQWRDGIYGSRGIIAPGIDIVSRPGSPGYFLWWPRAGFPVLCDEPVAEAPEFMLSDLSNLVKFVSGGSPSIPELEEVVRCHRQTARRWSREETYMFYTMRNEASKLMAMPRDSGRGSAVERAAFKLGGFAANGWIAAQKIYDTLFSCSEYNGLVRKDGAAEVRRVILRSLVNGLHRPLSTELRDAVRRSTRS